MAITMGMFDSFIDELGRDWQTKAFGRSLAAWKIGEDVEGAAVDCQVEVIGEPEPKQFIWTYATIRAGKLAAVPALRDPALPLLGYSSGLSDGDLAGQGLIG